MKEKGFTLIELLAVIVILAIIALIATPIILGIINDAKNESSMRSAELYLKGAELAIARYNLTNELGDTTCSVVLETGNLSCEGVTEPIIVEMDGEKPTSGTIVFSNGKITSVTNLQTSGKTFETDSNGKLVIVGSSSNTPKEQGGNTENPGDNQEPGETTSDEETDTPTMYYTWDLSGKVGETNAPSNPSTTPPTTPSVSENFYLGYNISEGKVSAAYVCFIRNSKEYCLKGNSNAFNDNRDVIREAFKDIADTSACSLNDIRYSCSENGFTYVAFSNGDVLGYYLSIPQCYANTSGFGCEEE